tara:strand:+ start:42 stop:863 length:822 start_codon:yes stop_codon:yes gene_type:complete
MFGSFSKSWILVKESYNVLKKDKELLLFPIMSGIFTIALLASFIVPIFFTGTFPFNSYLGLFIFYVLSYFIVIFFNSGLVICANIRLSGGDPTVKDGLKGAAKHIANILTWALIAATVGLILRILSDKAKDNIFAQIVISLLGMAWSLLTFFVLPIMILENITPIDAIKKSASLFKRTWGETVAGNFTIGGIFFIAYLILLALGFGSFFFLGLASLPFIGFLIIVFVFLIILSSTLNGIFITALYKYATTGEVPKAFSEDHVKHAFVSKNKNI